MTIETQRTLRSAQSLLRQGFCTKAYAKDTSGKPVGSTSSNAASWCIAGAIDAVVRHEEEPFNAAWHELMAFSGHKKTKEAITAFDKMTQNDAVAFLSKVLGDEPTTKQLAPSLVEKLLS